MIKLTFIIVFLIKIIWTLENRPVKEFQPLAIWSSPYNIGQTIGFANSFKQRSNKINLHDTGLLIYCYSPNIGLF